MKWGGGVFVVLAALMVATYFGRKYLNQSNFNLFKGAAEELREIGKIRWNERSINALTVIATALIVIVYLISSTLEKTLRVVVALDSVTISKFGEFLACALVVAATGIICLIACRER